MTRCHRTPNEWFAEAVLCYCLAAARDLGTLRAWRSPPAPHGLPAFARLRQSRRTITPRGVCSMNGSRQRWIVSPGRVVVLALGLALALVASQRTAGQEL